MKISKKSVNYFTISKIWEIFITSFIKKCYKILSWESFLTYKNYNTKNRFYRIILLNVNKLLI